VSGWDELLTELEETLSRLDELDEPVRAQVYALLDAVDALHRTALVRIGETLPPAEVDRLRSDPAVAWLLDAYGVGRDDRAAAEAALDEIRPYVHSHGGRVEVVGADGGVVRLRMAGACAGCTASAITLREGVERALREHMPGFLGLEVEEDDAAPHPPPGSTLVQIQRLSGR
jgi:Fe-S cluster biogenesis protein NfuA